MSIDLEAYFTRKPGPTVGHQTRSGPGWILNLEEALRIEVQDLAPELRPYLGHARWRVDIHLEGAATDGGAEALAALREYLVRHNGALVYDPQAGTVTSRGGTLPIVAIPRHTAPELGFKLAVFFEKADTVDRSRMSQLLNLVAAELPEALPHRYGRIEPPQGRWRDGGEDAFLAQWDPLDPPFWIGKTPVAYAYGSFHHPVAPRAAFRAGCIEIEFRPKLADDPNKLLAASRLAGRLALGLDAFYAALVPGGDVHGPWWKGVYPCPHLALVLGPPLLECWTGFEKLSRPLGDRHREAGLLHGRLPIEPPEEICFPLEPIEPELIPLAGGRTHRPANGYARVFPFPKTDPYSQQ